MRLQWQRVQLQSGLTFTPVRQPASAAMNMLTVSPSAQPENYPQISELATSPANSKKQLTSTRCRMAATCHAGSWLIAPGRQSATAAHIYTSNDGKLVQQTTSLENSQSTVLLDSTTNNAAHLQPAGAEIDNPVCRASADHTMLPSASSQASPAQAKPKIPTQHERFVSSCEACLQLSRETHV